jgi:hypothetical protein
VLLLVITFSSLINAGLMIAPVSDFLGTWQRGYPVFGTNAASLFTSLVCSGVLLTCVLGVAKTSQSYSSGRKPQRVLGRFALALLPLGLSMWAAHLVFHLATASSSLLPAQQQAWSDVVFLPQSRAFHDPMHMSDRCCPRRHPLLLLRKTLFRRRLRAYHSATSEPSSPG